jgi:hypothetical protein
MCELTNFRICCHWNFIFVTSFLQLNVISVVLYIHDYEMRLLYFNLSLKNRVFCYTLELLKNKYWKECSKMTYGKLVFGTYFVSYRIVGI